MAYIVRNLIDLSLRCLNLSNVSVANVPTLEDPAYSTPARPKNVKPIRFCTVFASAVAIVRGSVIIRDLECDLCQKIVAATTKDLPSDAAEDQVTATLDGVCSDFTQNERTKCNAFIQQYEEDLVSILREERDPGLACAQLGAC